MGQSMIVVAYIQVSIDNNRETCIDLAYSFHFSINHEKVLEGDVAVGPLKNDCWLIYLFKAK